MKSNNGSRSDEILITKVYNAMHIYINIYIYRKRERETEREDRGC